MQEELLPPSETYTVNQGWAFTATVRGRPIHLCIGGSAPLIPSHSTRLVGARDQRARRLLDLLIGAGLGLLLAFLLS